MTINTQNFFPILNYTVSATASSVPQAIAQPPNVTGSAGNAGGYTDVMISNSTVAVAYASWAAGGTAVATVGGLNCVPIPSGATMVFAMGIPATSIAVILSTGTGNVFVSVGNGS